MSEGFKNELLRSTRSGVFLSGFLCLETEYQKYLKESQIVLKTMMNRCTFANRRKRHAKSDL